MRGSAPSAARSSAAAEGRKDPLVGQIVGGRYRITQLLGEGGMGRVYLAEQQMGTNVRKVAVKTLQAQYAQGPAGARALSPRVRHRQRARAPQHDPVLRLRADARRRALHRDGVRAGAESLATPCSTARCRPTACSRIMAQVCGSLEEAHGRGVVHRDLKPDNIILTTRAGQTDFVKVLDFGIAKRSEAKDQAQEQKLTQQGMVLGTPPYMSPEQFTGKELDAAATSTRSA